MNILNSFILTSLAGLSTLLGFFAIYIKGNTKKIISFFLSMASGVMLIVSITDLIPSSYRYFANYFCFFRLILIAIFIVIGFLLSSYLEHLTNKKENDNLAKLGILSLISLVFHNVFEGIITFMSTIVNFKLGISLALAISLHNIPEGICIAIPLYYANKSKKSIFLLVLLASLSEILGAFFTYWFLLPFINNFLLGAILSLTSGIMISIGLLELLKESLKYDYTMSIVGFSLGMIIMILSEYL